MCHRWYASFWLDVLLIGCTLGLWLPVGIYHLLYPSPFRCNLCGWTVGRRVAYQRSSLLNPKLFLALAIIAMVAICR
jgi:hypothetical protein